MNRASLTGCCAAYHLLAMTIRAVVIAFLLALSACAGGQVGSAPTFHPSAGCGTGNNRACGG